MVAPKGSLEIHEEAWNAYPYCKTVLSNPGYMKGNFYIIVETYHLPDRGTQDNVHELEDKKLKKRSVVRIDIANDPVNSADFKADEDPTTFKSIKTDRGPLSGDWTVGFSAYHYQPNPNNFYLLLHPCGEISPCEDIFKSCKNAQCI